MSSLADTCVVRRFWMKVQIEDSGCWRWTAAIDTTGYGRFKLGDKIETAHRAAYLLFVGDVPDGLDLDHLCRNRWCCNPAHLEAVDRRTNLLRGNTLTAAHKAGVDCGFEKCRSCKRLRAA